MSIDVVRQGRVCSWSDNRFKVWDEVLTGVTKISYGVKRNRTLAYGQSRAHAPIGKTNGKFEPETLKVTMHRHTWSGVGGYSTGLRQSLMDQASDGKSIGNVDNIPILVQLYNPGGSSSGPVESTIEFQGCALVSDAKSIEENPDPEFVELEFIFERCIEDGATLYDSSEEAY
jgi:hypothetical protein